MSKYALDIKTAAAVIGGLKVFRKQGGSLSDFLENRLQQTDTPEVIGAKLLHYFCVGVEGQFNRFMPGVELAVDFLKRTLRGPVSHGEDVRSLKDLKAVLETTPTVEELLKWVRAHYH